MTVARSSASALRVLFVSCVPLGTATCRYRCEHLAEALEQEWGQRVRAEVVYVGQPRVKVAHDIVVLHRISAGAEGTRFLRAARRCGASLIYGTDDLVFDDEAAQRMTAAWEAAAATPIARFRLKRMRRHAPLHREMIAEADATIASTDFLAERLRAAAPAGKPVVTIRNFLNGEMFWLSDTAGRDAIKLPSRITLGYLSGTATHDADLASIAEPLGTVMAAHPEAELLLVGPVRLPEALEAMDAAGRVRRIAYVNWRDLPGLLAREVDINLAPLDLSHPFNHAKSEVKFLEAAAVRVPTVAASSAAMREALGEGGEAVGGFLASTRAEWEAHLIQLITDRERLRCAGEAAYRYLVASGTTAAHAVGIAAAFTEFRALAPAGQMATAAPRTTTVNWPFAPAKYTLKAVLERAEGRSVAPVAAAARPNASR